MDIGGWLRGLGLGKYEAVFRENEIDETVLPDLTALTLLFGAKHAAFNRIQKLVPKRMITGGSKRPNAS
jgi:hypothetical protein